MRLTWLMQLKKYLQFLTRKTIPILSDYFPLIILLIIYSYFQLKIINIDFWNDEIYTLKCFVFTSLNHTLTDYHAPNNHILFNLINNIYLKIIGVKDLYSLMDSPYKLRLLSFSYSLLTLIIIYIIGKQNFDKKIAILSVLFMITTIPFYNSATQIRGYGLSTLLGVLIIFSCFNYLRNKKKYFLVIVGILTALLFYTIPTNILFVIGLLCFYPIIALIDILYINKNLSLRSIFTNVYFNLFIAILSGFIISLILYLPVITIVVSNEYIKSSTHFSFSGITNLIPGTLKGFLSNRLLIAVLFVLGFIINIKYYKKWSGKILLFLTIILISSAIVFIIVEHIPSRIFVVFTPLFCILLSIGVYSFIQKIPKLLSLSYLIITFLFAYCITVFIFELKKIDNIILSDIKTSHRSQDTYVNYYIPYYKPQKVLREFKRKYYSDFSIVVLHRCEPHDLPDYLKKFEIKYYPFKCLDSLLNRNDSVYVLSNHPNELINNYNYNSILLSDDYSYLNIVKCEKK